MISRATAIPAGTIAHQAPVLIASRSKACSMIVPQVTAVGSESPRKASAVSLKIASVTASTAFAMSSGPSCGRMWRTITRVLPAPMDSARRIDTRSRSVLTCARTMRAVLVHIRKPMTSTTCERLGPQTVATTIISTICGMTMK